MSCPVCMHSQRAQIENAILNAPTTDTLERVAAEYNIDMHALQVHVLMHSPIGADTETIDRESIARKSKTREMDLLFAAANDYMVTLKTVGDKITQEANKGDFTSFSRGLSKAIVDLYLGTGNELRNTIKTIMDIDNILNGPKDSSTSGLEALAKAIRGSKE